MTKHSYSRHIIFESVPNFRDLGGYQTRGGHEVAWRRLFRSGELHRMTTRDLTRLREEIRLTSVLDLRNVTELERRGVGPLSEIGVRYYNVPLLTGSKDYNKEHFSNMGEVYLFCIRDKQYGKRVVEALEIIAEPSNHPLVFHCAGGKDRTGILAAVVLSVLGVADEDIIKDYTLSGPIHERACQPFEWRS